MIGGDASVRGQLNATLMRIEVFADASFLRTLGVLQDRWEVRPRHVADAAWLYLSADGIRCSDTGNAEGEPRQVLQNK